MAETSKHPDLGLDAELGSASEASPGESSASTQTLQAMQERLRRHSALEDLGPLFSTEAQGLKPSAQPAPRRRQA